MIHKLGLKDYTCAMKNSLTISYSAESRRSAAEAFARQQGLPCMPLDAVNSALTLCFHPEHIELRDSQKKTAIHVDFTTGILAHRKKYGGGRGQAIARAIGLKTGTTPPRVLDATAGLGKDAFVLACLGCPVTLVERSPIVSALVADAIERGHDDGEFAALIETGFQLINADATDYIKSLPDAEKPDVIFLDPMYPERKKSAQVKKNMQLLQKLLGQDEDTEKLLNAALACAKKRVVVKRPRGAESIGNVEATTCIESKKTRYDVYVTKVIQH